MTTRCELAEIPCGRDTAQLRSLMNETRAQNARAYAFRHELHLAERLGFGIHGIVYVAEGNPQSGKSAIKAHRAVEPYVRERRVYERLAEAGITRILGFHVPQLLGADDDLLVLEITIVTPPFVLDFAGAFLDAPPDVGGDRRLIGQVVEIARHLLAA